MILHQHSGPRYAGRRIGLMGGSFNPAHAAHLQMSLHALKRLQLDEVWWLVSPQNPLKQAADTASLAQRMQQARDIARHPRIVITDFESQIGTRYTADLLHFLKRRFSHTHFVWLMGTDNLRQIPRWHHWEEIFCAVPIAVFRRPAYAAGRKSGQAAERFDKAWVPMCSARDLALMPPPVWTVLDNPLNPLSSTKIRQGITQRGKS